MPKPPSRVGLHQVHVLRLVFIHDVGAAPARRRAHRLADRRQDVLRRVVEDLLRGIEPQAVEVKLVDPIARVGEKNSRTGPLSGRRN